MRNLVDGIQDSVFRNVENMLRIAILAYAKGENDVFASQVCMAAELVKSVWKDDANQSSDDEDSECN